MSCIPYEESATIDSNYFKQVTNDDDFYFLTLYRKNTASVMGVVLKESRDKHNVLYTL